MHYHCQKWCFNGKKLECNVDCIYENTHLHSFNTAPCNLLLHVLPDFQLLALSCFDPLLADHISISCKKVQEARENKVYLCSCYGTSCFVPASSSDCGVCNGRLCDYSNHISLLCSKEWICFVLLRPPSTLLHDINWCSINDIHYCISIEGKYLIIDI